MKQFTKDVELDAKMVFMAMRGGLDSLVNFAFISGQFEKPDDAVERAMWLKAQSEDYIKQVSDRVVEIELKN